MNGLETPGSWRYTGFSAPTGFAWNCWNSATVWSNPLNAKSMWKGNIT